MKLHYNIWLIFFLFISSCSHISPFEGSGSETEATYEIKPFNAIQLEGIFNIVLIQDDTYSIHFKGGENILNKFSFSDHENILILKHDYSNWMHNLEIPMLEIHCSKLDQIQFHNSSKLKTTGTISGDKLLITITEEADIVEVNMNLDLQELRFDSKGSSSGKHLFKGNCPKVSYTLNSSNNVLAQELKSKKIKIGHNGLGDANVWATDSLSVTFYNSGNVYYRGSPFITVKRVQINNQKATGQVLHE